jgi:hypothetical protein
MRKTVMKLARLCGTFALVTLSALPALPARAQQPAQPVDPGIGIRLLEAPTNRKDDPRARRYIVDHVAAGTTFSRRIELTNGTDRAITISLYSAAATVINGEFVPASGHAQNELSEWIKIDPATLNIPIGGRAEAKVTVAVPADVKPGERYAVALAELPPPPGAGLVGLASRVGIRVYLSVGPGSEPATDFDLKTFEPIIQQGQPGVSIHSCNTGGRALDLGGTIKLSEGPAGISAGPFSSAQPATVAPGECKDLKILLAKELPRGPWLATATLRSGTREKTSTAKLTFPAPGSTAKPVPAKDSGKTSEAPIIAAAAVILALLTGAGAYLAAKKRRRPAEPQPA